MTRFIFGFLRRNFQISQEHIKTNVYNTLFGPQVEYAAGLVAVDLSDQLVR